MYFLFFFLIKTIILTTDNLNINIFYVFTTDDALKEMQKGFTIKNNLFVEHQLSNLLEIFKPVEKNCLEDTKNIEQFTFEWNKFSTKNKICNFYNLFHFILHDKCEYSYFECYAEIFNNDIDNMIKTNSYKYKMDITNITLMDDILYLKNIILNFQTDKLPLFYERITISQIFYKKEILSDMLKSENLNNQKCKIYLSDDKINIISYFLSNLTDSESFNLYLFTKITEKINSKSSKNFLFFDLYADLLFYELIIKYNDCKDLQYQNIYDSMKKLQENLKEISIDDNNIQFLLKNNFKVILVTKKPNDSEALLHFAINSLNANFTEILNLREILEAIDDILNKLIFKIIQLMH